MLDEAKAQGQILCRLASDGMLASGNDLVDRVLEEVVLVGDRDFGSDSDSDSDPMDREPPHDAAGAWLHNVRAEGSAET